MSAGSIKAIFMKGGLSIYCLGRTTHRLLLHRRRLCGNVAAHSPTKGATVMARPGPETQAKRRREQAKKEKRMAKEEKKAQRRAQKKANAA